MVRRIKLGIFQRMQIVYQLYLDKIQQTPVNCVSNFVKTRKIPFVFFFVNLTAGADGRATGSGAASVVVWHIIRLFSGRESRGAPQTTRQALARHVKTKRNETKRTPEIGKTTSEQPMPICSMRRIERKTVPMR